MRITVKTFLLNLLILTILTFCFDSCATTTYVGDQLAATSNVDVYYAEKDVKREYKVIGHITAPSTGDDNAVKPYIIERAKKVGADGAIILGRSYTGGKDSDPFIKAEAIIYTN